MNLQRKLLNIVIFLEVSLLIDMEEQPEEKTLSIKAYVEKLAAALKSG